MNNQTIDQDLLQHNQANIKMDDDKLVECEKIKIEETAQVTQSQDLTILQATTLLNIPHYQLIKLLEKGEIPYTKIGSDRLIKKENLLKYQEKINTEKEKKLEKLIAMTEEAGLYKIDEELNLDDSKT